MNETQNTVNPFTLPVWRQALWTVPFAIMVLVATVGNLMVIWIVLAYEEMRTVTNFALVNLSFSDAMTSTLNTVFNYYAMLHNVWIFGEFYCKINQFISSLCISVSVFTLMAISIDRYMALVRVISRGPPSKRTAMIIAVAIWTGSALISIPNISHYEYMQINGTDEYACTWFDAESFFHYNVSFMALTYFMPILTMIYSYTRIGIVLWGTQYIGEENRGQLIRIENRKRSVKMMIVVVAIFAICWLPFQAYFVVSKYIPNLNQKPYVQDMYLSIYWLAMSHSMYNPMIYYVYLPNFRKRFKRLFTCCRCNDRGHHNLGSTHLEHSGYSLTTVSSRRTHGSELPLESRFGAASSA